MKYVYLDNENIVIDVFEIKDIDQIKQIVFAIEQCYGDGKLIEYSPQQGFVSSGYEYNSEKNVFCSKKIYDSWIWSEQIKNWVAPKRYPDDGEPYIWNEQNKNWEKHIII